MKTHLCWQTLKIIIFTCHSVILIFEIFMIMWLIILDLSVLLKMGNQNTLYSLRLRLAAVQSRRESCKHGCVFLILK